MHTHNPLLFIIPKYYFSIWKDPDQLKKIIVNAGFAIIKTTTTYSGFIQYKQYARCFHMRSYYDFTPEKTEFCPVTQAAGRWQR